MIKDTPVNAGDSRDVGSIPGLGRSPGLGNGNPLQYSCQENSMDRGAWWATVHEVAESDMTEQLSVHTHTHKIYWIFGNVGIHVNVEIYRVLFSLYFHSDSS